MTGLLLILGSVALGGHLIAGASHTTAWVGVTRSLPAGHVLTAADLRAVQAHLPASAGGRYFASAPTALVGCVEGELHTVGGRMAADFLIAQGWRTWYLNGLLPLEHLMEAVERHQPDAVVLCISTAERRDSLETTVQRLRAWRGDRTLPLLVAGGRYFNAEPAVSGLDLFGTELEPVTAEMTRRMDEARAVGS